MINQTDNKELCCVYLFSVNDFPAAFLCSSLKKKGLADLVGNERRYVDSLLLVTRCDDLA
jgi:hypothetical protein